MAKNSEKSVQVEMEPEFDKDGHQTRQSMIYGHIDPNYLNRLLLEHKADHNAAYQRIIHAYHSQVNRFIFGKCCQLIKLHSLDLAAWVTSRLLKLFHDVNQG